jgi:uncharacterized protein
MKIRHSSAGIADDQLARGSRHASSNAQMLSPPPDRAARLAARTPDGRRRMIMRHRWEALLFLHWRVPAGLVQQTLPPGLTVDTWAGDAYLGITPFFMRNVRIVGLPQLPFVAHFLELNVRTYVYDRDRVPGVWFYSLSCNQPLAVIGARWTLGLLYRHASMAATRGEFIHYSCRRAGTNEPATYRYRGIGEASVTEPDSLEFFLLERYYLFAVRRGTMLRAQISHAPYRYRAVEVPEFSTLPARLDGFTAFRGEPAAHACFVDGFDVDIYGADKVT